MIYSYGVSLPGTYHIKNNIVCQDSHRIACINKNVAVAAVADGLGSAAHSDVASKIAVKVAAEYCQQKITAAMTESQLILDTIRESFFAAHKAIEKEARQKDRSPDLYDTTLTLAVLVRNTLYYGHSGDSGILALTLEGRYEQVTKQQRDEDGRVFPLFFTDKWEFAKYDKKVSGVLLATDGMLETFFPIYIKNAPVKIHVSLAQFFMDNRDLRIDKLGQEAVQARMKAYMESIPDEQVNDDKTVAILINTAIKTKRPPKEYYEEPDWVELKRQHDEAWKRAAYPGLYKNNQTVTKSEPKATFPSKENLPNKIPSTENSQRRKALVSSAALPHSKPRKFYVFLSSALMLSAAVLLFVILPREADGESYPVSSTGEALVSQTLETATDPAPQVEQGDESASETGEYQVVGGDNGMGTEGAYPDHELATGTAQEQTSEPTQELPSTPTLEPTEAPITRPYPLPLLEISTPY